MPLQTWKRVAFQTFHRSSEDNVGLVAAGVAFYGFLALVPLLGATVLTYGIVASPATVLGNVKSLTAVMPADAAKLIGDQLMAVVQTSGGKKGLGLLAAVAVALFGARNAAGSTITALNIAYEKEETRGLLRINLLALAITAGAVLMAVIALLAIAALGYLEELFPTAPALLLGLGKITSYVLLVLGAAAGAATLYRYGPDRKHANWVWITPGTIFAAVGGLLLSLGFGFYAANFGSYNKTYGSLATVVILVTWMYLSAYVFLFGAELNSELDRETTKIGESRATTLSDRSQQPVTMHGAPARHQHNHNSRFEAQDAGTPAGAPSISRLGRAYATARATNRVNRLGGLENVGAISAMLSTVGLSLLRRRGRGLLGAALLAGAAGLTLMNRE